MGSLSGQILLASRRLADPNFFRTVVLMVQHDDEGALGLILNRPLEMTVKQACDDSLDMDCRAEGILHQGGPCQGPLMALHTDRHAADMGGANRAEVLAGLYFSTDRDQLEWLLAQGKPSAKFFIGYSGWGAGQLEGELESGSWLPMAATIQSVFDSGQTEQWNKLVTQITLGRGIKSEMIPDDPSVN